MAKADPFKNRIRELNKWEATDELTQVTVDMGHDAALTWDLNAAKRYMKGLLMNEDDYIVMTGNAVLDTQTDIP